MKSMSVAVSACLLALALACGGKKTVGPDPTGPQANNQKPLAIIVAPGSTLAREAVVFDASSSTDPEGQALTFHWDFGDGSRGGEPKLAHIFSAPGTRVVTLTVTDAGGAVSQATHNVTVEPGSPAVGTADISVRVRSGAAPVVGASVKVLGGDVKTTGSDGNVSIAIGRGIQQTLRVEAAGYLAQTRVVQLPVNLVTSFMDVALQIAPAPLTLAKAEDGGSLAGTSGAKVVLPKNALVDSSGAAINGAVQVRIAPVDVVADPMVFPGRFAGIDSSGAAGTLLSWGTSEFTFSQGDQPLNLAAGKRAEIELPIFTSTNTATAGLVEGDLFPLWSLDEASGQWVQEGVGTVVASNSSPTGLALRGEVGHFSWWNCDRFGETYKSQGDCCIDSNFDGQCDGPTMCYVRGRTNCAGSICSSRDGVSPPAFVAEALIPSGSKEDLLMPVEYPVRVEGYANNGLDYGKALVTGQAGQTKPFTVVLQPLPVAQPTQLVTLPHEADYASANSNSYSVFEFDVQALDVVLIQVERVSGSALEGEIRLFVPGANTATKAASFGPAKGEITHSVATTGRHRLEVAPQKNAPGGFRLTIKTIGQAPYVTSRSPLANATLVSTTGTITATFNTALTANSINSSSFKVVSALGTQISGSYSVTNNQATFTPTSALSPGVFYRVELTTAVRSSINANMAEPSEWVFATAEQIGVAMVYGIGRGMIERIADGNALVLNRDGGVGVIANSYTRGEGLGFPVTIHQGSALAFDFASDGENHAMLVYSFTNAAQSNRWELWARRFSANLGWLAPVMINASANNTEAIWTSEVAVDSTGTATVVWTLGQSGQQDILVARQDLNDTAFSLPTSLGENSISPQVAVGQAGQAVVTWVTGADLRSSQYLPATSTWSSPALTHGNSRGLSRVTKMDAVGNAYLLWSDTPGAIHARRYSAVEESWSTVFDVPSSTTDNCAPTYDVSSGGVAYITYAERPGNYINRTMRWSDLEDGDADAADFSSWQSPLTLLDAAPGCTQLGSVAPDGRYDLLWWRGGSVLNYTLFGSGAWPATAPAAGTVSGSFISGVGNTGLQETADDVLSTNNMFLWVTGSTLYRLR